MKKLSKVAREKKGVFFCVCGFVSLGLLGFHRE